MIETIKYWLPFMALGAVATFAMIYGLYVALTAMGILING